MDDEAFDGLFMQVVTTKRGIDGFLSSFYGFLRRRTDFFNTPEEAKQELLDHFEANHAYFVKTKEYLEKKQEEKKRRDEELKLQAEKRQKEQEEKKALEEQLSKEKIVEVTEEQAAQISHPEPVVEVPHEPVHTPAAPSESAEEEKKEEFKGLTPINNGGITDRYMWTQQLNDLTINFYIPEDFVAKNIKIHLVPDHITIRHNGKVFLDGELYDRVKPDDHTWMVDTVDGRKCIVLNLDKVAVRTWWKCAIKGEPEIDTMKVDPGNTPLSFYDEETSAVIEKGLLDARRKEMGLPTFDEMEKQKILREALAKNPELAKKFAGES